MPLCACRLLNAPSLSTLLGGMSTAIGNDAECVREPALTFETEPNPTKTALQAAVYLLTRPPAERASAEVLNGIAFDAAGDRLFVTGKWWPKLFEIRLIPKK